MTRRWKFSEILRLQPPKHGPSPVFPIKIYPTIHAHTPLLQFAHELLPPRGLGVLLLLSPPLTLGQHDLRLGPGTLGESIAYRERREAHPRVDEGCPSLRQSSDEG